MSRNQFSAELLNDLASIVAQRAADTSGAPSYTTSLLSAGTSRCAQKVGEEAVEVVIAATSGKQQPIIEESADLLYHLIVLWQSTNTPIAAIMDCLRQRQKASVDNTPAN